MMIAMNKQICKRCGHSGYKIYVFKGKSYCEKCVNKSKAISLEERIKKAKNGNKAV